MATNPLHSGASAEWYTPTNIVDASRSALGGIDFDPCTTNDVNWATVRATYIHTKETNALLPEAYWGGRALVNPPGGRVGGKSLPRLFWDRLTREWAEGNITSAVYVAYSLEQLQSLQASVMRPADFLVCVPRKRLRFLGVDMKPKSAPTHANCIIFLPEISRLAESSEAFYRAFVGIGDIMGPYGPRG